MSDYEWAAINRERFSTINKLVARSSSLKLKLQVKLQTLTESHKEGGFKRGKSVSMRHARYAHQLMRDSSRYGAVFNQVVEGRDMDTCVYLLVDTSGSMGMEKYNHACAACIMLWDALVHCEIPVKIVGFTTNSDGKNPDGTAKYGVTNIECVAWKEAITKQELTIRMIDMGEYMSSNSDGQSIGIAYHDLITTAPNKRKVMIVLSDGMPADGQGSHTVQHTKKTVTAIEREKKVELYGIGIESDAVSKFYKKYLVFNHAEHLETSLVQFVDRVITS